MSAKLIKFSYPVPSNKNGQAFSSTEELLAKLGGESAGQFLVGSQGMWHGGIHFTDATIPWCALSTESAAEQEYLRESYKGEQFIRCMADGEIVAYRVCKDYESTAIDWRDDKVNFSTSFVLVKHYIQPGENSDSGLTFYTLYMNLAPFSAYVTQDNERVRKAKGQKYYLTPENVTSGTEGSSLAAGMLVTLGDKIMTRSRDKHQFSLVTLADGKEVWTASDQGFLTPVSTSSGAMAPPWWSGCSPAYSTLPASLTVMKTTDTLRSYLSQEDVLAGTESVSLPAGTVVKVEQQNALHQMTKGSDTDARKFSLVTLTTDVKKPKRMRGDRVWVLSDNNNLIAAEGEASGSPTFNEVVSDVGIKIKAGDGLGHMGFYQLPEENGKSSRYQVHIECLSMDPLDTFVTNPAQVGVQEPTFVKYPAGATLLTKNAQGQMVDSTRKTKTQGIAAHSAVPVENVDGNAAYYQIHGENGWVAAADIQLIPQYALADRGFVTLNKSGASFDLINGTLQPNNIVKDILEQLLTAAQAETRPAYALNQYNYQRLLEQIDSNNDGHYSIEEYLQALQSVSYRDRLHHIIAKHASEWYYGKGDPLWATYLETLTNDAPQWKTYLETFIDKMTWMKNVNGLGPDPWHMHPVVFLSSFNRTTCNCEELYADEFGVTRYGTQYGPVYKGGITLANYTRWNNLVSEGKVTSDEKAILIAMSENEGNMDAVQSYDSEVITAGAMQKTVKNEDGLEGKGELSTQFAKFRDSYPDLYESYAKNCGWTVDGSGSSAIIYYSDSVLTQGNRTTSTELKTLLRQGCSESTYGTKVHNKPLAALLKILVLPEYLDIQVLDFIERLHIAENNVVTSDGKKIKDFVKTNFGRAVVLDHSVNRPSFVAPDFTKAIENFHIHNPTISLDPQTWGRDSTSHENKLLDEYKLTRRMTLSSSRFNSLKEKL
jgi:hypothetical protein